MVNLKRTLEKLLFAAQAIAAIENLANVNVITSMRNTGLWAVLKLAAASGASPIAGFMLGTLTNQIQAVFREPRLLVVTDLRVDHQPLIEASEANLPTIALCNIDSLSLLSEAQTLSSWANKGNSLSASDTVDAGPERTPHVWLYPLW